MEHLLAKLIAKRLDVWERKGAGLELSGRGDPVPPELEAAIADDARKDFNLLVEFSVEVAVGDMYAAPTRGPLNHLFACLVILVYNGIERPDVPEVFRERLGEEGAAPYTGETYTQEDYDRVRALFK